MSKLFIGVLVASAAFFVGVVVIVTMWITYTNAEASLRNQITAKQKANESELDNTIKTISQSAQVTDAQTKAFKEIIVGNAEARSQKGGSLATVITEAVPNLDQTSQTFRNLQNQIVAARNTWTQNQTQLLDLKRAHDNLIDLFPSKLFVGGKGKIDVVIVTSTRTEQAFKTGKDDDDKVFKK